MTGISTHYPGWCTKSTSGEQVSYIYNKKLQFELSLFSEVYCKGLCEDVDMLSIALRALLVVLSIEIPFVRASSRCGINLS